MVTLGIADVMTKKTLLEQGSVRAAAKVASGDAELLITLVSEILPRARRRARGSAADAVPELRLVRRRRGREVRQREAGKSLISCLSGPSVAATLKAKGMEKGS